MALIPPNGKITVVMPTKRGPVTVVFAADSGELWDIRVSDKKDEENWSHAEWKRARTSMIKRARRLCGNVAAKFTR